MSILVGLRFEQYYYVWLLSKMAKKKIVLSIDGGGIRGIIPGQILTHIENLLKEIYDDSNYRIADHFDLIAGTSTGGILACAYLLPDYGRPKFSAKE